MKKDSLFIDGSGYPDRQSVSSCFTKVLKGRNIELNTILRKAKVNFSSLLRS